MGELLDEIKKATVDQQAMTLFFEMFAALMLRAIETGDAKAFNYISFNVQELMRVAYEKFVEIHGQGGETIQ